jgi:hypothetical protein
MKESTGRRVRGGGGGKLRNLSIKLNKEKDLTNL